jgi:hypothetical protein
VKGKASTKQESAKVFEQHGSRKRAAATKQSSAKKQMVSPKAAAHPLISSVFAPVPQDAADTVASAAPGASPNRRAKSAAAAGNASIKSFFAQCSDAEADTARGAASAAAPAAKRTRAAARASAPTGPIKKFFVPADKRGNSVCGSEDVIIIDD